MGAQSCDLAQVSRVYMLMWADRKSKLDFPRRERGILVNSTVKTILFWVFILVCLMLLWTVVQRGSGMSKSEIGRASCRERVCYAV